MHLHASSSFRFWIPDHLRLCAAQVLNVDRNRSRGFSDDDHLWEAAGWLERAQDITGDGGVSGRYHLGRGWTSSYPETTGYIIPTFLKLADVKKDRGYVDRAERCVRFLLSTQLDSGAFPGGEIAHNRTEPSPFNSAQIIHGLLAWYRHANDQRALDAALRAADWLVSVQDPDGAYRRYFYEGEPATYSSHASCWLAELGKATGEPRYLCAASRHLDWVLQQFDERAAWFDLCGFDTAQHKARVAVSHTIAYTIFGVLYMSQLLGRDDGVAAARLAALGALRRTEIRGGVPGVMSAGWRSAADYACLTGNAQLALIWFRLFELDGDLRLVNAAFKALDEVKRAQPMYLKHPGLRGGIPGSAPVWGGYITNAVPNWAAKFFIDALLMKKEIMSALEMRNWKSAAPNEPDRELTAAQSGAVPLGRKPKIVLYTSTGSAKPHQILNETERWGFSPAAVVAETGAAPPVSVRVKRKLSDDGLSAPHRWLLQRVRPAARRVAAEAAPAIAPRELCLQRGIPFLTVESLNSPEALRLIATLEPDLAVNAGGGILRKALLEIPKWGTLNAHMGILPFYRGMNVAEWAALNGDRVGCSVHHVDAGIDTGAILAARAVSGGNASNIRELRELVDRAQIRLLAETLEWICTRQAMPAAREQANGEGIQFFTMHPELKSLLERLLKERSAPLRALRA
jgi:folate-dependent phosphoribosylglycinamide formyltransferase PurN